MKKTTRQMWGRKGGQTLFHRIFPATARGLTSTTAVDWHLKVKDIEVQWWHNQKLLHHYQHSSNQLNAYIHSQVQQILASRELKVIIILLSWICTSMQKINSLHLFILEIQSILSYYHIVICYFVIWVILPVGHTHLWPHPYQKFMGICINIQKIRLFHWFVLEIWLIKKSCNLTGQYLRNKIFPNYEICAGTLQIVHISIIEKIQ